MDGSFFCWLSKIILKKGLTYFKTKKEKNGRMFGLVSAKLVAFIKS